jgi:hypothetical protein
MRKGDILPIDSGPLRVDDFVCQSGWRTMAENSLLLDYEQK